MRRWILASCPLIVTFIISGYGFKPFKVDVPNQLKVNKPELVSFPEDEALLSNYQIAPPFLGRQTLCAFLLQTPSVSGADPDYARLRQGCS